MGSVQYGVGVTQRSVRRHGFLQAARIDAINSLVVEVGEPHGAGIGDPGATTVFVDSGTRVERRRVHVGDRAVRFHADYHVASAFRWTRFGPEDCVPVNGYAADADGLSDDGVGGDRRAPGTERSGGWGGGSGHGQSPLGTAGMGCCGVWIAAYATAGITSAATVSMAGKTTSGSPE